jgi:hypothetical protein
VLVGLVGRSVRGKLRGSWAERSWQRPHVPGLHERSLPVACASPGHHGMEEVRGSSPLSSTVKVLVRAHLILRDACLSNATEGHLGLTDAVRPPLVTIRWA